MNRLNIVGVVIFFKFLLLVFNLKHLLKILLIFEFISLNLFFISLIKFYKNLIFVLLVLLVLFACEARIGLSILIRVIRLNYNRYVENFDFFIV